jgi:bacillithiol biosynthesis deacetylase BshB1
MSDRLDILACGAHPDDMEIACGGLLLKMVRRGYRVAICDLTRGELASNGTPEIRQQEASAAGQVLQLSERFNLGLPDGALNAESPDQLLALVRLLRQQQPRMLIGPDGGGRHPDHAATNELVRRAQFFCGVAGYDRDTTSVLRPVHLQALDFHPMQASFVVDISDELPDKLKAIRCYRSQFEADEGSVPTLLNGSRFLQRITTNAATYGQQIGCAAGEPFRIEGVVPLEDPLVTLAGDDLEMRP